MLKFFLKRIAPIVFIILALAGCWDSRDLEDRSILTCLLIDKTENTYAFYAMIAGINAGKQDNGGGSSQSSQAVCAMVKGGGKTYMEARKNVDSQLEQPIFLGAVQSIIITERLAKQGIDEYIMRLRQTPEYRKTVSMVITAEDPEKLINFKPKNEISIGFGIDSVLKNLVDSGEAFPISLAKILGIMATPNDAYVLYTIGIKSNLDMTGYSVFQGGKLKGFIPREKSKGLVYLKSNDARFEYQAPSPEGNVTVLVRDFKKNIQPQYDGGKISFDLSLDINTELLYPDKSIRVLDEENRQIIYNLQNVILDEIADTIRTSQQKFKCDYLDFYNIFRIRYPEEIKAIEWNKAYQKAEFRIKVSVSLDRTTTIHYHQD